MKKLYEAKEDCYFRRQDQELIENLRNERQSSAAETERSSHRNHCGACGGDLEARTTPEGVQYLSCKDCNAVLLTESALDKASLKSTSVLAHLRKRAG